MLVINDEIVQNQLLTGKEFIVIAKLFCYRIIG